MESVSEDGITAGGQRSADGRLDGSEPASDALIIPLLLF